MSQVPSGALSIAMDMMAHIGSVSALLSGSTMLQ